MERILNSCPQCQQLIDVTDLEPYSKVQCEKCGGAMRIRTTFNHFQIKEQIGIGGMSCVFRARDTALNRDVALKILNKQCSSDRRRVEQFEKEARTTALIQHPNVVKVFTSGTDQGNFYIAMELVRGGSLDDMIRREKKVPEAKGLEIALQTAQGLKAALNAGLIHRDIKPGNILFADDGTPKIVDFGLALMFRREKDPDKEIWATPYYVPPEKLHNGTEDHRSDIYSLGATLYHALLGKPPFETDTNSLEELRALKSNTVKLTEEQSGALSPRTISIVECCLQKEPADRYATYDELITHLELAIQERGQGSAKTAARRSRRKNNSKVLVGAAAVGLIAIAASIVTAIQLRKRPPSGPSAGLQIDTNPAVGRDTTISAKFSSARDALFRGELPEAQDAFWDLASGHPAPPTENWAVFNAGICALLRGDLDKSGGLFARIAGAPGPDQMGAFFKSSAEWLATPNPVPPEIIAQFPADSYQSMALLAAGLKNWQLGEWRGALEALEKFQSANPPSADAWVSQYKSLIAPHLEDLGKLKAMPPLTLGEATGSQAAAALEKARAAVAELKLPGEVKKAAAQEVETFAAAVADKQARDQREMEDKLAALKTQEMQQLVSLRGEAQTTAAGYQFAKAAEQMEKEKGKFQSPDVQVQIQDEVDLWKAAGEFLAQLGRDLAAVGFEGEIERSTGPAQRVKVQSAAADGLVVRLPNGIGESTLPYTAISPAWLIKTAEMAVESERVSDSDEYWRRREMIVAFCLRSGQNVSGLVRGQLLSREWRGFRTRWERMRSTISTD